MGRLQLAQPGYYWYKSGNIKKGLEQFNFIKDNGGSIWGPEVSLVNYDIVKIANDFELDIVPWFGSNYGELEQKKIAKEFSSYGIKGIISDWFV